MSEVKVNKISPRTACGTVTLGDSGDTFTIPSGATITNAGTASGFGATGETSWDTTVKTTGTFTATAGVGYFLNTTGGIITVNLPAGSAGDSVALADYAGTWQTNKVTLTPNGSEKIGGTTGSVNLTTEGQSVTFVYIDGTQGWVNVLDSTSNVRVNPYIVATGGTPCSGAISGDYKIHTFTGPGTFCVSSAGTAPNNVVDYLVVAAGGGGGAGCGGGAGAGGGGFRFYANTPVNPQAGPGAPRNAPAGITVTATGYPITVGGGGTPGPGPASCSAGNGGKGNDAVFSTITSTGGGYGAGAAMAPPNPGGPGGSGGASARNKGCGGAATPITSPVQGTAGYTGTTPLTGGGGGGAMVTGGASIELPGPNEGGGPGGAGAGITGFGTGNGQCSSCVQYFSGGGAGANFMAASCTPGPPSYGLGGIGGGGAGALAVGHPGSPNLQMGVPGTDNTGGGAGAGGESPAVGGNNDGTGGAGGSGIVVIRYKFQ